MYLSRLITSLVIVASVGIQAEEAGVQIAAATVAQDSNVFGFKMYSLLRKQTPGNMLFSPYSISSAFGIVYAGAAGSTAEQIKEAMHYSVDADVLNRTFGKLNRDLTNNNRISDEFKMVIANALWLQTGLPLLPEFSQILNREYQVTPHRANFATQPEAARAEINSWVKERTFGRIVDIVPPQGVDRMTRLLLVNTVYLKAQWRRPFDSKYTRQASFFPDTERTLSVPTIENTDTYAFAKLDNCSLIELPYLAPEGSGLRLGMVVVLPNEKNGLEEIERSLTVEQLLGWMQKMQLKRVNVILPKFTMNYMVSLKNALQQMGMVDPFSKNADFSKLSEEKGLSIGQALHKSFMSLDEHGTEVAAATAISIGATSIGENKLVEVFRADHPFLFFIIDKTSGVILFLGRLASP